MKTKIIRRRATRPAGPPAPVVPQHPVRRTDVDLRALARDVVTGRKLVTADDHVIRSAFYIMTTLMNWSQVDTTKVAALIGDVNEVVPGRAMNGYPIFLTMGMLHVDDVAAYDTHLQQMLDALQ